MTTQWKNGGDESGSRRRQCCYSVTGLAAL
jgi:hypothetical protein